MTRLGLTALLFVLLAATGCERAETTATFRKHTRPQPSIVTACWPVPGQVGFGIPLVRRSDAFYQGETGDVRRRLVLQYLEIDQRAAIAAAEQTLLAAGFQRRSISSSFTEPGYGSIILTVKRLEGVSVQSAVRGTMTLSLPASSFDRASGKRCPQPGRVGLLRGSRSNQ